MKYYLYGRNTVYRQVENQLTQPNAAVELQDVEMGDWLYPGSQGDLLELYCGNGNFLSPLCTKLP